MPMFSIIPIRENSYRVEIDIPYWRILKSDDQAWLRRELDLCMEGRSKDLVLSLNPDAELRKKFPAELGHYFCSACAGQWMDEKSLVQMPAYTRVECDVCGDKALCYVGWRRN